MADAASASTHHDQSEEVAPPSATATSRSGTAASRNDNRPGSRVTDSRRGSRGGSALDRPPSRVYTGGGAGNPEPRPGTGTRVATGNKGARRSAADTRSAGGLVRLDDVAGANHFPDEDGSDDEAIAGGGDETASAVLADVPLEEVEESSGDDADQYEMEDVLTTPNFPWKDTAIAWFGPNSENAHAVYAVFRDHYLKTEGIVFGQHEWDGLIAQNRHPYKKRRAESMVQLLVGLLARKHTKKRVADDKHMFAAALRTRHGEEHFEKMARLMERYLNELDDAPLSVDFLVRLGTRTSALAGKGRGASPFPSRFAIQQALEEADITAGAAYADKNGFLFTYKGSKRIDHLIPEYTIPTSLTKGVDFSQFDHNPVAAFLGIVAQRRLRLLDMFRMLDRNRDGTVTKKEALKSMKMLRMPLSEARLENFIDSMDEDGDGTIGWKEMVKARVVHLLSLRTGGLLKPSEPAQSGSGVRAGSGRGGSGRGGSPGTTNLRRQASGAKKSPQRKAGHAANDLVTMHKDLLEEYEAGAAIDDGAREALLLLNTLQSEAGSRATDRVKVAGTGLIVGMDTLTELALVCHYATRP